MYITLENILDSHGVHFSVLNIYPFISCCEMFIDTKPENVLLTRPEQLEGPVPTIMF